MTYIAVVDAERVQRPRRLRRDRPEVFRLDDTAVVIGTGPDELILEAAESCPAVAISVVDEETERPSSPRADSNPTIRTPARRAARSGRRCRRGRSGFRRSPGR